MMFLAFFGGVLVGALFGVVLMALLQANDR